MQIEHDDILYPRAAPFVLIHLACVAAIWTGVTPEAIAIALFLYFVRMFGVTAGYHRYFSHRSFRTSRWFQFVLAFLAQTSTQKGALWWAASHRHHHRHSDTESDVHSPRRHGFLYAHLLWVFSRDHRSLPPDAVPDLARFPELLLLERFNQLPSTLLAIATLLVAGWPGFIVGFCWSTVLLYHATFAINSLAHASGRQRYDTGDDSGNNWWLAIITMGEGWHNNHHAYQRSARQGFQWYEVDVTFYILTILSWTGLVWDLGSPPRSIVDARRPVAPYPALAPARPVRANAEPRQPVEHAPLLRAGL